jgi:hypothetical protein
MSQMITLVGLGLLAYLYFQSESEKYEAPSSSSAPLVPITHALTHKFVQLAQPEVVKKLGGKCLVYPIDTSYIRQDGDVFHCRFMFTVLTDKQYPYGIDVNVDIRDNQVISIQTESQDTVDHMEGFEDFETSAQLKQEPLPTLNQLQSAFALA